MLGGVTTLSLFTLHGAVFLSLKTGGAVRSRARVAALRAATVALPATGTFLAWTQAAHGKAWTLPVVALAGATLVAGVVLAARRREGWSFAATAVTVGLLSVTLFGSLYPLALPSTTDPAYSLTVSHAASAPYTLTVMTWLAVVFLPLVLGYQAWSYWVFRKRVTREHIEPTPAYGGGGPGDSPDGAPASAG